MSKRNAASKPIPTEINNDDEAMLAAYFGNNMIATRAWMETHPKANYASAGVSASEWLKKPKIKAEIKRRLDEKAMSAEEAIARIGAIAKADLHPFIRVDRDGFVFFDFSDPQAMEHLYLIKKIKTKRERRVEGIGEQTEEWEGEWVEVELHDAYAALRDIAKMHGKLNDKPKPPEDSTATIGTIPGELLTSDFLAVNRDILAGRHAEYTFDGGRGSLKSTFISEIIPILMMQNPNMHALVLRQVAADIRESVYSQIKWSLETLGISDKFEAKLSPLGITYLPTGQQIFFRGANDPSSIKSIKPPFGYIGILWLEELDQFHGEAAVRSIVQSALRGGEKSYRFESWNTPRTKNNWVNKYIAVPKEERLHTRSNYQNVPAEWLGQTFLMEAEHLRNTNPAAYEHEYAGVANSDGGMIFENVVQRAITDEEIKQFDNVLHGLDFGFSPDPANYTRMHYDAARRTLYIFGELRKWKMGNEDMHRAIKEYGYTDNELLIADSAESKSVADYRAYGANCRGAEKGKESRKYSYRWLQGLTSIIIDPKRAPYCAEEFTAAEYPRTKDGEIISEYPSINDHAIDSVRYATNLIWRQRGQ